MRRSGISRRIDELGRITIPKEMRKNFNIHDGDMLDINASGDGIVLSKPVNGSPRNKIMNAAALIDECTSLTDDMDSETIEFIKTKAADMNRALNKLLEER